MGNCMIELERTFLPKFLPDGLEKCKSCEIFDIYIPKSSIHPILRIRKIDGKFEITKKIPVENKDASHHEEKTISLSEKEFEALSSVSGKTIHKTRYYYEYGGKMLEIDVFNGPLEGLVLVDLEFQSENEKNNFPIPPFCLADVTNEWFSAGGMLCGKSYSDIETELKKFGYVKITGIKRP